MLYINSKAFDNCVIMSKNENVNIFNKENGDHISRHNKQNISFCKSAMKLETGFENVFEKSKSIFRKDCNYYNCDKMFKNCWIVEDYNINKTILFEKIDERSSLENTHILSFYESNNELSFYSKLWRVYKNLLDIEKFAIIGYNIPKINSLEYFVIYDTNKLLNKYSEQQIKNKLLNDELYIQKELTDECIQQILS